MCSIIEIHTPTEFSIRYETEDSIGSQRLQRTRNFKLIRGGRAEDTHRDMNTVQRVFFYILTPPLINDI